MNCLSGSILLTSLFACSACGASTSDAQAGVDDNTYSLHYTVSINRDSTNADVSMALQQSAGQVREISFAASGLELQDGSNDWEIKGSRVHWSPDSENATISWTVSIPNQRNDNGYDAWLDSDWGIFRAEDIIPRVRSRVVRGAQSRTTLSFELPSDWSFVTEYSSVSDPIRIDNPARQLDQPTGWIGIGDLGIRRETIAGTKVAVVGPKGQAIRRMDMLALLNWALPELEAVLSAPLPRVTIFSADDPMWRGGLSAPASVFIHADRPLISENATSTLIHELMHIALRLEVADNHDWITEGLAEYYSLELLQRSGAITARRYRQALDDQAAWAKQSNQLCGPRSSGATTALAVTLFRRLDVEIRKASSGKSSLDDAVVELLQQQTEVDLIALRVAIAAKLNQESAVLHIDNLPGCSNMIGNGQ